MRVGPRVAVIGGGNVSSDVALTVPRQGAQYVAPTSLDKRRDMSASPDEIELAVAEGVQLHAGWGPMRIEHRIETTGLMAHTEAQRCLRCDVCIGCGLCMVACSEMGIEALRLGDTSAGRLAYFDFTRPAQYCIGCGACTEVCPTSAIHCAWPRTASSYVAAWPSTWQRCSIANSAQRAHVSAPIAPG